MMKLLFKYGHQANSHDITKAVAIVFMVIDHIGLCIGEPWLRVFGRAAAPLFFFLIGYSKAYHWQNRLLVYAVALAIIIALFFNPPLYVNILFVFIIIRLILKQIYATELNVLSLIGLFIVCNALDLVIHPYVEYGTLGLQIALLGLFVRENRRYALAWGIATVSAYCVTECLLFNFTSTAMIGVSVLLFMALGWWFCCYQQKIWPLPRVIRVPTLLISRYSLPIYFYHYALIIVLYYLIQHNYL